jgi:pteridine reductase
MNKKIDTSITKTALITGGAKRIGAAITTALHNAGYDIFLHYGTSKTEADALANSLNAIRANSCFTYSANLNDSQAVTQISEWIKGQCQQLDVLVNNASSFFPTPWETANQQDWQALFTTNVQTPFFLTQSLLPLLTKNNGSVINLIDIHAERTLEQHPIYCASKAALKNLTMSLAKDHGHQLRCNGISPGAILWPNNNEQSQSTESEYSAQQEILNKIPAKRLGDEKNISDTVLFLVNNSYINGQIINVDGGRTVYS